MVLVLVVVAAVLAAGVAAAVAAGVVAARQRTAADHAAAQVAAEVRAAAVAERDATVRAAVDHVVTMARERLSAELAAGERELDAKKDLIDGRLAAMGDQLERVAGLVAGMERDRARTHGELTSRLEAAARTTAELTSTTASLREALASPQARGQWGERMAEDVLRLAGFVEGVNYLRQRVIEGRGTRPDFTFPLPRGHVVHMDAKFPAANYLRYLEAAGDDERARRRADFLRDVRQRVRELTTRDYVDPAAGTVDYVLLFIPNESVYGFIHEQDPTLLDEALRQKVVPCSPFSLFAVLAVIRQAFDNFVLEQTSNEVLSLLGAFADQWDRFCGQLDKVGARIEAAGREYERLATTRRRQLERPLARIEELRRDRDLPVAAGFGVGDGEVVALPGTGTEDA